MSNSNHFLTQLKHLKVCQLVLLFSAFIMLMSNSVTPSFAVGEAGTTTVGWGTTFYITKDGTLWGFGDNAQELLLKNDAYIDEPIVLLNDVKSVAANRYAVLAVKRDGTLWYWGRIGKYSSTVPSQLLTDVSSVALEPYYSNILMVLKTNGELFELEDKSFVKVEHDKKVKYIATGGSNRFFIDEDDVLWAWSTDKDGVSSGALGVGHTNPVLTPEKVLTDVQSVASYSSNTMIIRKDGSLWMCGNGDSGKLYTHEGIITGPVLSPIKVMDQVIQAAIYDNTFLAVKSDHTLWTWGDNQIVPDDLVPTKLEDNVLYVSVYSNMAIIKKDNTLWTGGGKKGTYKSETTNNNAFRLTAQNLQDSPSSWAIAEVREAEYRKLVPLDMQNDYMKIMTRSEFCTLAIICIEETTKMPIQNYLAQQNIELPKSLAFEDISNLSQVNKDDIFAAYALDIINGTSQTTFSPNKEITREQAARMLFATAAALGKTNTSKYPNFSDQSETAPWALESIGYVYDLKIMSGVGNNRFNPKGGYQRQQAYITMLHLYQYLTQ